MIAVRHSPSDHTKVARNSADSMLKNMKPKTNSLKHLEQSVASRETNNRYIVVIVVALSLFVMFDPSTSTISMTT